MYINISILPLIPTRADFKVLPNKNIWDIEKQTWSTRSNYLLQ